MSDPRQEFVEAMRLNILPIMRRYGNKHDLSAMRRAAIAFADLYCPEYDPPGMNHADHNKCRAAMLRECELEESDAD